MCQVNTFMFKDSELDGEKLMKIINIFQEEGFTNFYEYNNPNLRNIRRDLRLFQCGNFCDCGSVITKKVVVDEIMETVESEKLTEIIKKTLDVVGTTYLFSHWYWVLGLALSGIVLDNTLIYIAARTVSAVNLSLLNLLGPIFLAVLTFLFFKQRIAKVQLLGIVITIFGMHNNVANLYHRNTI